jgi:hypothetical protein
MITLARAVDLLALAFAFGSTVWFFFIQSPVMVKRMGRDRFVPLQMSMALVLFRSPSVAAVVMAGASFAVTHSPSSTLVLTALLALAGAVINSVLVLPRALKTAGASLAEVQSVEAQSSIGNFVSQGAGQASGFWHRLVVLFVVVMVGGLVPHAVTLVSAAPPAVETAHEHEPAVETAHAPAPAASAAVKWKANAETTEGVATMLSLVRTAAQRPSATPADLAVTTRELDEAYQTIFRRCTMKGDAHEALHGFLLPVGPMLKDLERGEEHALHRLEAHLATYGQSFE